MKTATLTLTVACLVAVLQTGALATEAAADHGLRTTDYYLSHESWEPFYRQNNLPLTWCCICLLYTSDAADDRPRV